MLAHRLRHRVTFQHNAPFERDENNVPIPGSGGWQPVTLLDGTVLENVPAEVLTGPGREWVGSGSTQSEVTARINLRWFPATEREIAAWRVVWDGRIYNVLSADTDVTARREWRLRCVDGPSEGQ